MLYLEFISAISLARDNELYSFILQIVHGTWNWVDETPFDYNNWHDGEPNHNDDFNYCAKIYEAVGDDYVGTWDDDLCNNLNGFICEKKRSKHFIPIQHDLLILI